MTSQGEEQKNKQTVRQYIEALNRQDTDRIEQLVSSSNYSLHFSGMPPMDMNGSKQFLVAFTSAFPDLTRNIKDMVAEGDKVAVSVNITGTHNGELLGIRATGKKVSFMSMEILTIIDGKVTEERATADRMELMQQIGAIPADSNATKW